MSVNDGPEMMWLKQVMITSFNNRELKYWVLL